jgi:CRISPR/Cas system-associated exonuclease Cas4 (RecB family)
MKDRLTKTAYLNYLKCPQEFWLDYHQKPVVPPPITLEHEHLRQQGYLVEQYVKKLAAFQDSDSQLVDFQRSFQTMDLYARSDIIVTDKATGKLDIYEIKAASKIKDEHYDDVAFQKIVVERSGFNVGRCFIITMNGEYVRCGEIDPEQLFVITEVTEEIAERIEKTEEQIFAAIRYLEGVPVPSLVDYCVENKLDCRFIQMHFTDLPDYTVFDIVRLHHDKRRQLLGNDIIDIRHVPDDFKLSEKQRQQIVAAREDRVIIEYEKIAKCIEEWRYPLHFLDYETFSFAVPQFDGIRPFQQMCFQYSLHTIRRPGGRLDHSFFLSYGNGSPARELAEHLQQEFADGIGTVFVWYESFEKTRNTEMAEMFPDLAPFFEELNAHTCDLMKVFSENLYIDPKFKGRSSIKKVLPVLKPELSYGELGIGDGLTASISWFRAATWDTLEESEREKIFENLKEYCHLDTLAMVEIYNELASLVKPRSMVQGVLFE